MTQRYTYTYGNKERGPGQCENCSQYGPLEFRGQYWMCESCAEAVAHALVERRGFVERPETPPRPDIEAE